MSNLMRRNQDRTNVPGSSLSGMVNKVFQDNLSRFFDDDFWGLNRGYGMEVSVNVRQSDKNYEIEVVAPGLNKGNFKIDVHGNLLTVSFEQKEESTQQNKEEGWVHKEYHMRSFNRSFNLDDSVDVSKIEANYKDGMLRLTLPIKEGAQPISRTIEIS